MNENLEDDSEGEEDEENKDRGLKRRAFCGVFGVKR